MPCDGAHGASPRVVPMKLSSISPRIASMYSSASAISGSWVHARRIFQSAYRLVQQSLTQDIAEVPLDSIGRYIDYISDCTES